MKIFLLLLPFSLLISCNSKDISEASKFESECLSQANVEKAELLNNYLRIDFSTLWMGTPPESIFGFIGDNFQRIKVKFISVEKDPINPRIYHAIGKTNVQDNICPFEGKITLRHIRKRQIENHSESIITNKGRFILSCSYEFFEPKNLKHAGFFKGFLVSYWILNVKDECEYDQTDFESDHFSNNQFVGLWTNYKDGSKQTCNWGDYRIPNCKDLDIGAGEFSPNKKYFNHGWENYSLAFFSSDSSKKKTALSTEKMDWWK